MNVLYYLKILGKEMTLSVTKTVDSVPGEMLSSRSSAINNLFQGEHRHWILFKNCSHESVSFDHFTVLSLPFHVSGNCTLISLPRSLYEDYNIDYRCIRCNIVGRGVRKKSIQAMHPILAMHLD